MQILPVLDILDAVVVRGIAGRREEYRPLVSQLTTSSEPLAVANAIRDQLGVNQFYVADLDGILKQHPNHSLYQRLISEGFTLLIDTGIRDPDQARLIAETTKADLIVGLESCRSPQDLKRTAAMIPDVAFSLDLFQGKPHFSLDAVGWSPHPAEIVRQVIGSDVKTLIVLDLADVGKATGGSTDLLCRFIRSGFPDIRLIAGGGVRGPQDLSRLAGLGLDAVLVASALHDGRITREDISINWSET